MPSLAEEMAAIDESIFDEIGETIERDGNEANGIFNRRFREIALEDGTVIGLDISFECQVTGHDWILALREGDEVTIGSETYRFGRRYPDRGDETGRVVIELKELPDA